MKLRIARLSNLGRCAGPLLIVSLAAPTPAPSQPAGQQESSESSVGEGAGRANELLCLTCTGPRNGVFSLIQNHRAPATSASAEYKPLTAKQKFAIAFKESTDPGTFVLAAAIGGLGQARSSNPSFGQEFRGYSHYASAKYGEYVISDFMREAIFPSLLHQDPRYFRLGTGNGWSRLAYAARQTFWARSDSGRMGFNYSQIMGGASAVAISAAYYPEIRDGRVAIGAFGGQIGAHIASNVMKEFWPDVQRAVLRKHGGNRP